MAAAPFVDDRVFWIDPHARCSHQMPAAHGDRSFGHDVGCPGRLKYFHTSVDRVIEHAATVIGQFVRDFWRGDPIAIFELWIKGDGVVRLG